VDLDGRSSAVLTTPPKAILFVKPCVYVGVGSDGGCGGVGGDVETFDVNDKCLAMKATNKLID
jgi:hypothetical protein